ncbi:MAG: M13 family peptidase [Brevundimonas sp.]|nr:MAG: M13 family peptidase [Brevundimonas sp.]
MITRNILLAAVSALTLTAACAPTAHTAAGPVAVSTPTHAAPMYGAFGFDEAGMDKSVAPGDEFYDYANGGWAARTEIPADKSRLSTFDILNDRANARNVELIRAAAAGQVEGESARKVGDYFTAYMDEATIERLGTAPLRPALSQIAAIDSRAALSREIGATMRADVDAINATSTYTERPLGLWVAQDFDHPDRYAPYLMQGGLGMPDRDYYLSDSQRFVQLRDAYVRHVAAMLTLAGVTDGERRARGILALETAIARSHWDATATGDMARGNNTWRRTEFVSRAPGMDWNAFFQAAQLDDQDTIKVWQPEAITGLSALVASQPLDVWKDYLAYHAVNRAAPFLSKAFVDQRFSFHGTALTGASAQSDRWKRAVASTNASLGDAVGQMYVARHFSPEAKAEVQNMVQNIKAAFDARIAALEWMTPATKTAARAKLAAMTVSVGYPDRWKDYSALEVRRDDALGNADRAAAWEYQRNIAKLHGAVDRGEWFMVPQTVNALNAPSQNSIQFPAAILEPPFFDPNADPAVNYGAIGAVIGHEISHGFDNSGALFDVNGKLTNWWTPSDFARFDANGQKLVAQYNAYRPYPDLALNGQLTLGENIADVAGLSAALDAYHRSLGGRPAPVIDGFTGDQRFFLGFAQNYRGNAREASDRNQILTNGHSPGRYRAATVRNLAAWYDAFGVQPGQRMYLAPADRVEIW